MAAPASSMQSVNSWCTATITILVSDKPLNQTQTNALEKELNLCPMHLPDVSTLHDISMTYCLDQAHLPDVSIIWKSIREYLLQVDGISMGTELTPSFASTFMTGFEEPASN